MFPFSLLEMKNPHVIVLTDISYTDSQNKKNCRPAPGRQWLVLGGFVGHANLTNTVMDIYDENSGANQRIGFVSSAAATGIYCIPNLTTANPEAPGSQPLLCTSKMYIRANGGDNTQLIRLVVIEFDEWVGEKKK